MNKLEENPLHITDIEAERYLNQLLSLPATGKEQDWEIELANPLRIAEFVSILKEQEHIPTVKYALMALILASYDIYLDYGENAPCKVWNDITLLIEKDFQLYIPILKYWSCGEEMNPDYCFGITGLIREVLNENS